MNKNYNSSYYGVIINYEIYIVNVDNNVNEYLDITLIILGISIVLGFLAGLSILYYNKCIKNNNNDMSLIPVNDIISDI